jgi:hypothetical protein
MVLFLAGARDLSFLQSVPTDCGAHLASYVIATENSFLGSKVTGFEAEHVISECCHCIQRGNVLVN